MKEYIKPALPVRSPENESVAESARVPDDTPLDKIGIIAEVLYALDDLGLKTIGDVRKETAKSLVSRGIRPKHLREIRGVMRERGEALREE